MDNKRSLSVVSEISEISDEESSSLKGPSQSSVEAEPEVLDLTGDDELDRGEEASARLSSDGNSAGRKRRLIDRRTGSSSQLDRDDLAFQSTADARIRTTERLIYIFSQLDQGSLDFLYGLARHGSSRNGKLAEQILRDGLIAAANAHLPGSPSASQSPPQSYGQLGSSNVQSFQPQNQQMYHTPPNKGHGSGKRPRKHYAVRRGHRPGVYADWDEAEASVSGFPGARFRGFRTKEEAQHWFDSAPNFQGPVTMSANQTVLDFPKIPGVKSKL